MGPCHRVKAPLSLPHSADLVKRPREAPDPGTGLTEPGEAGSCHCSVALSGSWRAEHESVIQLLCLMGDGPRCPLLRRGWRPRELPAAQGGPASASQAPGCHRDMGPGTGRAPSRLPGHWGSCTVRSSRGRLESPHLAEETRGPMTTAGSNPHLQGS